MLQKQRLLPVPLLGWLTLVVMRRLFIFLVLKARSSRLKGVLGQWFEIRCEEDARAFPTQRMPGPNCAFPMAKADTMGSVEASNGRLRDRYPV